jgi:hypothetical protein
MIVQRQGRSRNVGWRKADPFGVEFAKVRFNGRRLSASGVAVGVEPQPYRLDYLLETSDGFVTRRLRVAARGDGLGRSLDLRRERNGAWSVNGEENDALEGALDCDLGLSPLTNSMPVLREGLLCDTFPRNHVQPQLG